MTQVYQNCMHKKIKSMLRWGSVCCHLDWNFLSFLQAKNIKDEYIQNYNFGCCLYRREAWLCTLSQECRLRVLETRVQRMIFGPMREEGLRNLILILCSSYHVLTARVCVITFIESVIISYSFLHIQIDLMWYKLMKKYILSSDFSILRAKILCITTVIILISVNFHCALWILGDCGGTVVKVLCYK
jgi:hypothetical protein